MTVLRIALLLCDTPLPPVVAQHGNYLDIYRDWLNKALETYPDARDVSMEVDGYDVVDKMEYPDMEGYDVLMLTGSKHTAHDRDNPFIPKLIEFVRRAAEDTRLRIVGVCFGHQIISLAMGGECVPGKGWEVGVYGNDLNEEGKYWWGTQNDRIHRDQVPRVTPGFRLLASSAQYPVHSMVKLHPDSTPSKPIAHILTIQGHPEFTPEIVSKMVDVRAESGVFDEAAAKEARRRLVGRDGTGGEGFGLVGWAIIRMMLSGKNIA